MNKTADVIVIGAGIAGLSVASELLCAGCGKVIVIERETQPGMGETAKTTGGIRFQFSDELNIKLSLISREKLSYIEEQDGWSIDFHQNGYLFLASTQEHLEILKSGHEMQRRFGIPSHLLDAKEIRQRLIHYSHLVH